VLVISSQVSNAPHVTVRKQQWKSAGAVVTLVVVDVIVVLSSVLLGIVAEVVVVVAAQLGPLPGSGHASQQLEQEPGVPPLASHAVALRAILQFVFPAFSRQHVTEPGRPQFERDTHSFTRRRHWRFTSTASI
jgi:hypothetical protein